MTLPTLIRPALILAALLSGAMAPAGIAQIPLDDGSEASLGDPLPEIAARLRERVFDVERGRPGIDRMVVTNTLTLFFDTDRLWRVVFKRDHLLLHPLAPFAEEWKNPSPIGEVRLGAHPRREAFDSYLEAWRGRAAAAGKRENVDYWVSQSGSPSSGEVVTLQFSPRRRLRGTGTLIGDTLSFSFLPADMEESNARYIRGAALERANALRPSRTLNEVTATGDAFGTRWRETDADRAVVPAPRINGRPLAGPGELGASVTLDDGKVVRFGQGLSDLETLLGKRSDPDSLPLVRAGNRREIVVPTVKLEFSFGRLESLSFQGTHSFAHPLRPFDEPWQQPDPIGDLRIRLGMTRGEFDAYLEAWKQRAMLAGKREDIDFTADSPSMAKAVFTLALAPFRLTRNGRGIWSDSWGAMFSGEGSGAVLESFNVHLDAYNPSSRPAPGTRDPTFTGVTLEDGTELYFGQALDEVERLTGASAGSLPVRGGPTTGAMPRISLRDVAVDFDAGRLQRITYRRLAAPPAPFPQLWKNLTPVNDQSMTMGMSEQSFRDYLAAWENSLKAQGLERDRDYRLQERTSENSLGIFISMRPMAKAVGGGWRWDSWSLSFNPAGRAPNREMRLISVTAMSGAFSARPITPTPAAQRREEVRAISKEAPKLELPPLELDLPRPQ